MNILSNWKTTAFGVSAAVILVILTYIFKHTVDPETLTTAAGLIGIGSVAGDASTTNALQSIGNSVSQIPFLNTNLGKDIVGFGDSAISLASASHPTNVILADIKTGIDALNSNINSQASQAPATPIVITNTATSEPIVDPIPEPVVEQPIVKAEPIEQTDLEKAQAALKLAVDAFAALTPAQQTEAPEKVPAVDENVTYKVTGGLGSDINNING